MRKFNAIELLRREKRKMLETKKISTYSRDIEFTENAKTLIEKYHNNSRAELTDMNNKAIIMMRIMIFRGPFLIGKDAFGSIQVYISKDISSDNLELKKYLDIGDIIKVDGTVMKTKTGQITIKAIKLKLITKSVKPLPEKFYGLKDQEDRYRKRYVDLIVNDNVKDIFWKRAKLISLVRKFFDDLNYMEVETPVLSSILGGANAKPFVTYHNALNMDFYLRIATELPLKRLLVGGIDRVYEIGRLFRNEGIDTTHNPEFTTIEFYEAYSNLQGMMNRTEALINNIAKKFLANQEIIYKNQKISLAIPFRRIKMTDAILEIIGYDVKKMTFTEIKEITKKYNIKIESYFQKGHLINKIFEELVEKTMIQPTFIYEYPIEVSPLAAKNEDNRDFTERAELFINGKEYANMFTELNDPEDQWQRFNKQIEERKAGNTEANELDIDYVEALEYGMPPAGGCGIGIDRLVMLFTKSSSIREVLLFPHLKNKKNKVLQNDKKGKKDE